MFFRLLFLLTFIPILEIFFLIRINKLIGGANTLLLIFITGFIGAWLLRRQGGNILADLQRGQRGQTSPVTQGILIFIGGVLLLTPGVITDALGLSLVFPLTQKLWKKFFVSAWGKGVVYSHFQARSSQTRSSQRRNQNYNPDGPFSNPDFPNQNRKNRSHSNPWDKDHQSHGDESSKPVVIDIEAKSSETRKK